MELPQKQGIIINIQIKRDNNIFGVEKVERSHSNCNARVVSETNIDNLQKVNRLIIITILTYLNYLHILNL